MKLLEGSVSVCCSDVGPFFTLANRRIDTRHKEAMCLIVQSEFISQIVVAIFLVPWIPEISGITDRLTNRITGNNNDN